MIAGIFFLPDNGFRVFIGAIVVLAAREWANIAELNGFWRRASVMGSSALLLIGVHCLLPVSEPICICCAVLFSMVAVCKLGNLCIPSCFWLVEFKVVALVVFCAGIARFLDGAGLVE